jgi:hypothetical protein
MQYNHDYKLNLSIGSAGAEYEDTLNPSKESSYSREEWNALTTEEQQLWLEEETLAWANNYIDYSWSE